MKYRKLMFIYEKLAQENNMEPTAIKRLLVFHSGKSVTELVLSLDDEMSKEKEKAFVDDAKAYIYDNIPVQHMIGYDYFYGYKIKVNPDVLIPRMETEELVANVLTYYDEIFLGEEVDVVDIGTGSGAIAIALANEESKMKVTATDISAEALKVAEANNISNNNLVTLLQGDMLEPLKGMKFDIIVSNPPYIPDTEDVPSLVKDHEPNLALYGGDDGLKFYRIIINQAREFVKEKFIIAFEHAYDKGSEIRDLGKKAFPSANVETLLDLQGKERMTFIINK